MSKLPSCMFSCAIALAACANCKKILIVLGMAVISQRGNCNKEELEGGNDLVLGGGDKDNER